MEILTPVKKRKRSPNLSSGGDGVPKHKGMVSHWVLGVMQRGAAFPEGLELLEQLCFTYRTCGISTSFCTGLPSLLENIKGGSCAFSSLLAAAVPSAEAVSVPG